MCDIFLPTVKGSNASKVSIHHMASVLRSSRKRPSLPATAFNIFISCFWSDQASHDQCLPTQTDEDIFKVLCLSPCIPVLLNEDLKNGGNCEILQTRR